MNLVRVTKLN